MTTGSRIGLVGPRHDDEMLAISRALRDRGALVRVIDLTGLPGAHCLEVRDCSPFFDGRPLDELDAIYVRRLRHGLDESALVDGSQTTAGWEERLTSYLEQRRTEREVIALIWSALSLLEIPIVNPLESQLVHPRKLHHLRRLAAAQLPVPPLIASNDAAVLEVFVETHRETGVVIKPLRGLLKTTLHDPLRPLPLRLRPVMAQQYIRGKTLRVYAIEGRPVVAAAMHNAGDVDSSVDPQPAEILELTDIEGDLVSRAMNAVGLTFTGMDLQRPADGSLTRVLECNAAPMFANFCRRTGADVAGPLAAALIAMAHCHHGADRF